MLGLIKNLSFYKKNANVVSVYLTLQDNTATTFEGDLDELKEKMTDWSGRPNVKIEPVRMGVNPLKNLNFV